nr:AF177760_1 metallothionein-like protein [Ipomoea batatas]
MSSLRGCGMFPDVENVKTVTLIQGVAPVNKSSSQNLTGLVPRGSVETRLATLLRGLRWAQREEMGATVDQAAAAVDQPVPATLANVEGNYCMK